MGTPFSQAAPRKDALCFYFVVASFAVGKPMGRGGENQDVHKINQQFAIAGCKRDRHSQRMEEQIARFK